MFKLIVIDIDGTLTNKQRLISLKAIEKIREVEKKGISITFASGNVLPITYALQIFIGTSGGVIAENGGIILLNKKIYKLQSKELPFKAYKFLKQRMEVKRVFTEKWRKTEVALVEDFDIKKARKILKNFNVILESTGFAIHIMNKGTNKFNGIKFIADIKGINLNEIMAIGDSENDYRMVKNCYGVAVANAVKKVKKVAKYVCEKEDGDGICEVLNLVLEDKLFSEEILK